MAKVLSLRSKMSRLWVLLNIAVPPASNPLEDGIDDVINKLTSTITNFTNPLALRDILLSNEVLYRKGLNLTGIEGLPKFQIQFSVDG